MSPPLTLPEGRSVGDGNDVKAEFASFLLRLVEHGMRLALSAPFFDLFPVVHIQVFITYDGLSLVSICKSSLLSQAASFGRVSQR